MSMRQGSRGLQSLVDERRRLAEEIDTLQEQQRGHA